MPGDVRDPFGFHSGVRSGSVWANFGPKFPEPKISNFKIFRFVRPSPPRRGPSSRRPEPRRPQGTVDKISDRQNLDPAITIVKAVVKRKQQQKQQQHLRDQCLTETDFDSE